MLLSWITAVLAFAAASRAHANDSYERYYTAGYNQCLKNSDGGDFSIRDCTVAEIAIQDGRLNEAYKLIMKRLMPSQMNELRQAERLWVQRRDATCKAEAVEEEGGTLWRVVYSGCILDQTIKRRLFLEKYK